MLSSVSSVESVCIALRNMRVFVGFFFLKFDLLRKISNQTFSICYCLQFLILNRCYLVLSFFNDLSLKISLILYA